MTPERAEEIVCQYGAALANIGSEKGIAKCESNLPCPRDQIKNAFKLVLAFLIEHESLTQAAKEQLLVPLTYLHWFVPDAQAKRINTHHLNTTRDEEYRRFRSALFDREIVREMEQFINEVHRLDLDDPLFHQRVYTMIGLEYSPSKKRSFWDLLRGRKEM